MLSLLGPETKTTEIVRETNEINADIDQRFNDIIPGCLPSDTYKSDVQATIESASEMSDNNQNIKTEKWSKFNAGQIKSSYSMFVVPKLAPKAVIATKKDDMISALRVVFKKNPDDFDIYEEDIDESEDDGTEDA